MKCPHCGNSDRTLLEFIAVHPFNKKVTVLCAVCSKMFYVDESERHTDSEKK